MNRQAADYNQAYAAAEAEWTRKARSMTREALRNARSMLRTRYANFGADTPVAGGYAGAIQAVLAETERRGAVS